MLRGTGRLRLVDVPKIINNKTEDDVCCCCSSSLLFFSSSSSYFIFFLFWLCVRYIIMILNTILMIGKFTGGAVTLPVV